MNAVVLTSENSEAFYAQKLGLPAPEPVAAAASPEGAKPAEVAVESERKPEGAPPEPETDEQQTQHSDPEQKRRINVRFSELTERSKAAEAKAEQAASEAKAERERADLAEKRAKDLEAKLAPPPEKADPLGSEPKPEQFKDAFEYAKALAEWSTEKALAERDQKEAQRSAEAEAVKVNAAWHDKQEKFKAATPDYEAVITSATVMVSEQVRDAIRESDVGPALLYHLATHPKETEELAKLRVGPALKRIGKLEAKLEGTSAPAPAVETGKPAAKPAAAASEISRAPAPITPLRGGAALPDSLIDANGVFHGTHAQWKKAREEGKIK